MATYNPTQLGINSPSGGFQQGAWYSGRQYWNGTLSDVGSIHPDSNQIGAGKAVSQEVVNQSSSANWSFIQNQNAINATSINQPMNLGLPSNSNESSIGLMADVNTYRTRLDQIFEKQKAETDAKLAEARKTEQEALSEVKTLATPFREDLENSERERLYINKNFEENQKLVDELELLLNEGNALIKQQQQVTGLASIRNPRIQQTMNDVQARTGVIQAVINARNGQIAQAETLIDRSVAAITNDRIDQLNYYQTVLNLANRDIIMLDTESKRIAQEQIELVKTDLTRAQNTVDYVKQLLLSPDTAALMGTAGVKLTDSVEQINGKLQNAIYTQELRDQSNNISLKGGTMVLDPSGVPANQLVSFTDSRGKTHYYKMPASGSGSGFDMDSFYKQLTDSGVDPDLSSIIYDVVGASSGMTEISSKIESQAPIFSPSGGIGTRYTDPATGVTWVYKSNGWVKA